MSSWIYFARVKRLSDEEAVCIPQTLTEEYLDNSEYSYNAFSIPQEWEKEIGIRRNLKYHTIDRFDAVEKLMGKRPVSLSVRASQNQTFARFEDGKEAIIDDERLKEFTREKEETIYVYYKEELPAIEHAYLLNTDGYEERLLNADDMLSLAERYYAENDGDIVNEPKDYGEPTPLEAIMTAYFSVKEKGGYVLIYLD